MQAFINLRSCEKNSHPRKSHFGPLEILIRTTWIREHPVGTASLKNSVEVILDHRIPILVSAVRSLHTIIPESGTKHSKFQ